MSLADKLFCVLMFLAGIPGWILVFHKIFNSTARIGPKEQ